MVYDFPPELLKRQNNLGFSWLFEVDLRIDYLLKYAQVVFGMYMQVKAKQRNL